MSKPEEFTVHIEPDGRILLETGEVEEVTLKRLVQMLEETVGQVQTLEVRPGDPPTRHLTPGQSRKNDDRQEIGRKNSP